MASLETKPGTKYALSFLVLSLRSKDYLSDNGQKNDLLT